MNKIFVILVLLFPCSLLAQPAITSVSGTFASGDTLTIYGTGFGQKSPAAPVFWIDFEDGTLGENVATSSTPGDGVIWGTIAQHVKYTDVEPYSGTKSAATDGFLWRAANSGFAMSWSSDGQTDAKRAFMHLVAKWTHTKGSLDVIDGTDGMDAIAFKWMRLNTHLNGHYQMGDPNVWFGTDMSGDGKFRLLPTASSLYYNSSGVSGSIPTGGSRLGADDNVDDPHGEWLSGSLWGILPSACYESDGNFGHTYNSQILNAGGNLDLWRTNIIGDTLCGIGYRGAYFVGHHNPYAYPEELPPGGWPHDHSVAAFIGEAYADTSVAHVMAFRDESYAFADSGTDGPSAIQIPIYWSDTEIRVVANTGYYPDETSMLLTVMDGDGLRSDYFEVTVSAEFDDPTWAAPVLGTVANGVLSSASFNAVGGAVYYLVRLREGGEILARSIGHTSDITIPNIPTSTATGTVYVTAHAANDSLLATSQAAAYGGN